MFIDLIFVYKSNKKNTTDFIVVQIVEMFIANYLRRGLDGRKGQYSPHNKIPQTKAIEIEG